MGKGIITLVLLCPKFHLPPEKISEMEKINAWVT